MTLRTGCGTLLVLSIFVLTACSNTDDITGAARGSNMKMLPFSRSLTPQLEVAASVAGRMERGIEDDILRMEHFVPGLGGAFTENGVLVIYAPVTTSRAQVVTGVALASSFLSLDDGMRGRMARGEGLEIRPSRYAFSQLVTWVETSGGAFFAGGGVSWIDADERLNKLSVSITDEKYRARVMSVAAASGIPYDAINVVVAPRERAMTGLTDSWSPTGSGIQITNASGNLCSIGWNVHRGGDGESSEEGFITASHCAPSQPGAGTTGPMYQPLYLQFTPRIGFITQNPAWNVSHSSCDSAGVAYCGQVDAMYVRYDDPSVSLNRVPYTALSPGVNNNGTGTTVTNWWTIISASSYSPWVGDNIDKVGRTTGWTRGTLSNTCAHNFIDPGAPYAAYMVLCMDKVQNARAGQGDSGAPVFVPQNSPSPVLRVGVLSSSGGSSYGGVVGQQYCTANCIYSYSRMTRIGLFLAEPPY